METAETVSVDARRPVELAPEVEGTKKRLTLPMSLRPQKETPWLDRTTSHNRSGSSPRPPTPTQRLELGWRPHNGGLTFMTLLLRGARFVDGIYIPADVDRPDDPGEEVSAA